MPFPLAAAPGITHTDKGDLPTMLTTEDLAAIPLLATLPTANSAASPIPRPTSISPRTSFSCTKAMRARSSS